MRLTEHLSKKNIILASASPRRQMLLSSLGVEYQVIVKAIDEVCPGDVLPSALAECLAERKAMEFRDGELKGNDILITADTVVFLGDELIGKPEDEKDAIGMLMKLSGKMHTVYTGVCIRSNEKKVLFTDETKVWFAHLTPDEIASYVHQCQPYDKAGSYGIQEWIGYAGVERIEGSFFNVMGFPTHRVYRELLRF
ncbi:MAG: Maf family protein [Bacteroidales bacterium]